MQFKKSIFMFSSVLMLSLPVTIVNADTNINNSTNTETVNKSVNPNNNKNVNSNELTQQTKLTQTNNQTSNGDAPSNGTTSYQTGQNNNKPTENSNNNNEFYSYYDNYGYSHFTRYNLEHMQDSINTPSQNPIGDFSKSKISDVMNAVDERPAYAGQQMNVWDSWPLQDANGQEVTYHGYHLVFALAGNPNADYKLSSGQEIQDSHIYLFYQKVKDEHKGINSWQNAGQVFNTPTEGSNGKDAILNSQLAQWSGQTILTNGQIHMFYTSFNGSKNTDWQALATAKLDIKATRNGVKINHKGNTDNKSIATADGNIYQTLGQAKNDNYDENVFRDVHYFMYKGKPYIIFAANSTDHNGPEGQTALSNRAYLGGNSKFQLAQYNLLSPTENNPWHLPGVDYNAVIGVAELNSDFSVKRFKNPILGLNTITDEFERPNLFEHNGKWYLFGITRGYKLATPNVKNTDSYLIGFVSNSPFGKFKPLNKNGLVVRNTRAWSSRKYSYSFYILNSNSNTMVMTSYMTNAKLPIGHQTFAPSMLVKLNGDKAIVEKKVLKQGQLVK